MHLVLLVIAALLVVGCTAAVEEAPPAPTAPPTATGLALPPRPREVRLDGVDPCSLLTAEQRAALGLESEPNFSQSYVALFRGVVPTCTARGPYPESVLLAVGLVTTVGIERWQEPDVAADIHPVGIAGFPAITAVPRRFTDYCNVEVDVAPGQLLDVQYGSGGPQAGIPQDELCRRAGRAAEEMMRALLAR